MKKRFTGALLALCMVFALGVTAFGGEAGGRAGIYIDSGTAPSAEKLSYSPESLNVQGITGIRLLEIDGKGYSSFQSAIDNVREGQTIKLMVAGYTLYDPIIIPENNSTNFKFDLNGYTLSGTQGVIIHRGSGTLTIKDSMNSRSARLTTSSKSSDTVQVQNDGGVVLESGTIEHSGEGAPFAAAISGNGSIDVKGGTVRAASGCAVLAQFAARVSIAGGVVSAQNGIAIYTRSGYRVTVGGTAKITSANTAADQGTIVMLHSETTPTDVYLQITGGTVENTAPNGNAIINRGSGTMEISGGVIDGSGENGTGVLTYNTGSRKTVAIKKGSPVIKGRGRAISGTPTVSDDLQVSAGNKYESDSLADSSMNLLFPDNLHKAGSFSLYKYLRFNPTTAVAKVGIEYYTELQDAFDSGASGSTIYLLSDLDNMLETVFNEKGRSFTLDLNGKTLINLAGSAIFNAWGDLTITDSSAEQSGCINDDIKNGVGTLTIAGGTVRVSGNNAVAISSVERSGPIVVTGGTVSAIGTGAYAIRSMSVNYPVRVSGNAVISSESGWAISSKKGVVIEGAGPIIKGGFKGLNTSTAPSFDSDNIDIEVSDYYEGMPTTPYDESMYYIYRYFEFVPARKVWLSGNGLKSDNPLNAEKITGGDDYTAMVKLEEVNDVFGAADFIAVYRLSLKNGTKTTGYDIYVNFKVSADNAEQPFTMVYKNPDNTYEYFYATAKATGEVHFGPIKELSTVMLVKGMLPEEPVDPDEMNTQAGGVFEMYLWGINVWWFIGAGAALTLGATVTAVILLRKRKKDKRSESDMTEKE